MKATGTLPFVMRMLSDDSRLASPHVRVLFAHLQKTAHILRLVALLLPGYVISGNGLFDKETTVFLW
jgi:hypothetical protein